MLIYVRTVRSKIALSLLCASVVCASLWRWSNVADTPESRKVKGETIYERKGKVVILFSSQRSGSTFVGEFFNRFENGFYLYEPLLPFTPSCERLYEERLEFLKEISHCDFRKLQSHYATAQEVFHVRTHRECRTKNICAPNHHPTLLQRYADLCHSLKSYPRPLEPEVLRNSRQIISKISGELRYNSNDMDCNLPVNLTLWSSLCYSAEVVAFKILRVCSISALEGIARRLTNVGNTVYVIDLVRDPRAIINSALKLELRPADLERRLKNLCGRYRTNLKYVKEQTDAAFERQGIVTGGRYLRVRYEDIANEPVAGARKIYNHIGMDLPEDVKKWIEESAIDPEKTISDLREVVRNATLPEETRIDAEKKLNKLIQQRGSPYGTVRDSQKVIEKWRSQLSMNFIESIQSQCSDVMDLLDYKQIKDLNERNNLNMQLW